MTRITASPDRGRSNRDTIAILSGEMRHVKERMNNSKSSFYSILIKLIGFKVMASFHVIALFYTIEYKSIEYFLYFFGQFSKKLG